MQRNHQPQQSRCYSWAPGPFVQLHRIHSHAACPSDPPLYSPGTGSLQHAPLIGCIDNGIPSKLCEVPPPQYQPGVGRQPQRDCCCRGAHGCRCQLEEEEQARECCREGQRPAAAEERCCQWAPEGAGSGGAPAGGAGGTPGVMPVPAGYPASSQPLTRCSVRVGPAGGREGENSVRTGYKRPVQLPGDLGACINRLYRAL